jgi:hypothetical protein
MRVLALIFVALTLPLSSHAAKAPPGAPPEQAALSICNPSFELASGPNDAGTAFVLASPLGKNKKFLSTAHHLFGPDGGVEPQISWQALPKAVKRVTCQSTQAPAWQVIGGHPLAVKDAKSYAENGPKRDIAVFALETAVPALTLATAEPKVGDLVWLVAQARSGAAPIQLLHKARVVEVSSDQLVYAYENKSIGLGGSSGAPVVNEFGQVVAVNFGGGKSAEGEKLGFGTARSILYSSLAELDHPVTQ